MQKTGTTMLSRRGMLTAFEYQAFQNEDPVTHHERYQAAIARNKKSITAGIIPGRVPTIEQLKQLAEINEERRRKMLLAEEKNFNKRAEAVVRNQFKLAETKNISLIDQVMKKSGNAGKGHSAEALAALMKNNFTGSEDQILDSLKAFMQNVKPKEFEPQESERSKKKTKYFYGPSFDKEFAQIKGSAAFKSLTRDEIQEAIGYYEPSYAKTFHNDIYRYNPRDVSAPRVLTNVDYASESHKKRPRQERTVHCEKGLRKLVNMILPHAKEKSIFKNKETEQKAATFAKQSFDGDNDNSTRNNSHNPENVSAFSRHRRSNHFNQTATRFSEIPEQRFISKMHKTDTFKRHEAENQKFLKTATSAQFADFLQDNIFVFQSNSIYKPEHSKSVLSNFNAGINSGDAKIVRLPGDIGTQQTSLVNLGKQQERTLYYEEIPGANEKRFTHMPPEKLEVSSKHLRATSFDLKNFSERPDLYKGVGAGKSRRQRPPSGIAVYYDVEKKKQIMSRLDSNIISFGKTCDRPSQIIKHAYNFEMHNTDSDKINGVLKSQVYRKTPIPLPFDQLPGREDNLMYNINAGNNLDAKVRTYFDKHNLYSIFGRSASSTHSTTYSAGFPHRSQTGLSQGDDTSTLLEFNRQSMMSANMTLEEKLLAGFYKPKVPAAQKEQS